MLMFNYEENLGNLCIKKGCTFTKFKKTKKELGFQ